MGWSLSDGEIIELDKASAKCKKQFIQNANQAP
jgi:hypothetical protein